MRSMPVSLQKFSHLYPFSSHFLAINGLRYHYVDEGHGDTLIMVHGNPTWSFFFRRLILSFRKDYRVIAPDHIGCGLSDKPDLDTYDFRLQSRVSDLGELIDKKAPDRPLTLIVHDWGGMIALAWAQNHWSRVKRMVIMNTSGFLPPRNMPIPWILRLLRRSNPFIDRMVLRFNLFARGSLYLLPQVRLPADVRAGLIAPYNCPRHRLATLKFVQDIPLSADDFSGSIVARVEKNLHKLKTIPTLLLWGGCDFVFSRAYYNEWLARLPHAEHFWLADAGHYLLEDKPDQTASIIGGFLRDNPL